MNRWRFFHSASGIVRANHSGLRIWRAVMPLLCCTSLLASGCDRSTEPAENVAKATAAVEAVAVAPLSMTDEAKRAVMLDVLERFVPFAESFWRNSDLSEPNSGRYDAVGSGVTQPRGAGDIAFAYVTLLKARPDQLTFGGISRDVLIDHTIQSIRHEALTNALSGKSYKRWGGGTWQASLETYSWAFAAHRLWDRLDEDTRALVKRVVVGEANILITKPLASGEEGDTGAEDNAWNSPTPALAAMMFPEEANAAAWENAAMRLAINASSMTVDASDATVVDGKPLSQWMGSVNLHPDMTLENHGFFNPIYQQVTHVDINDAAIAYGEGGRTLPEAFSFRTSAIWENVLMRLATDEGDFVMPAGQDWTSKDFQHLAYLGILATRMQRADASVFESRALDLVARRQATHPNGSMLGYSQIGYETMLIKRLAALWWTHELFGPAPVPTEQEFSVARSAAAGVKSYAYSDFIAARLGQAFVSMSWDPAKPMGLVVPHSGSVLIDPIFAYYAPKSLLGNASGAIGAHECDCQSDRFSTAGSIGARQFSMTAFPDGVTLLLDRGTGTTFTYALEDIAGLTGARPIWSSANEGLGNLAGSWVNAADRMGMIVRGGGGLHVARLTGTNNQIVITGSNATGTGNRGALLLPNVDHTRTAELELYATQPATPEGWSALGGRASDQSVRLAVARWSGPQMAALELSDERGAPVPEEDAAIVNGTAQFTAHLGLPASHGETIRFFVDSTSSLRAQQQGEDAALVRNPGEEDATITVTYARSSGIAENRQRLLLGGQEAVARVVDGSLTLAGPELESLVAARNVLSTLSAQLPDADCDRGRGHERHRPHGCRDYHHGLRSDALLDSAMAAVNRAIELSQAADPNERQLAWAIARARWAVELLEHSPLIRHLPADLAQSIRTTLDTVENDLEQATDAAREVTAWVVANGLAQPGEMLPLQVTLFNRGTRHVTNGTVTLSGPDGWSTVGPIPAFDRLVRGDSVTVALNVRVPPTAKPGDTAKLVAELAYDHGRKDGGTLADVDLTIAPILDLRPTYGRIPLAVRGANQAPVRITNFADHALEVALSATAPAGVTIDNAHQTLLLPAAGCVDLTLLLRNVAMATGTGQIDLLARTAAGVEIPTSIALSFSDDLALNTVGAPWPLASATSNQAAYPPTLAFDGNASTFWVSGGTVVGEGPTPTSPKYLMVDFGLPELIGSVRMVPRVGYGPKAYTIEVSDNATDWQVVANVPNAPNGTVTTQLSPVTARYLRLMMTAGWDWAQPPRNVQIIALNVRAPAM